MMDYGISTGIGRDNEDDPLCVYLHIASLGSVTCSPDTARMLATQLILNADLVEGRRQEEEEE